MATAEKWCIYEVYSQERQWMGKNLQFILLFCDRILQMFLLRLWSVGSSLRVKQGLQQLNPTKQCSRICSVAQSSHPWKVYGRTDKMLYFLIEKLQLEVSLWISRSSLLAKGKKDDCCTPQRPCVVWRSLVEKCLGTHRIGKISLLYMNGFRKPSNLLQV